MIIFNLLAMVSIEVLDELAALAVESCETLSDYVLVSSEAELKDMIEDCKFPLLVGAYPSADGDDVNRDNMAETNLALWYVLKTMSEKNTKAERLEIWAETQRGMKEFKEFLYSQMTDQDSDFFKLLQDANFDKRSIDPEYNFLECVGWSLKFDFSTDGL